MEPTGFLTDEELEELDQFLLSDATGEEVMDISMLDGFLTLEDRHEEFAASLGACVMAIQEWWLPVRKAKSTTRREEPKVGRNAPCPCGSGKKFKQCCGGQKVLH
jgi:uncharacterized protein YecA (UPF0149 family)